MVDRSETVVASRGAIAAMTWFYMNSLDAFLAAEHGVLGRPNDVWLTMTGRDPAEAQGKLFWDFVHPEDVEAARAAVGELELTQRAEAEHRISTADGGWLWVRNHA